MDLQTLEEFVTLSIVRNYSAAAAQLNISQSSLSRHIMQLENEMGECLVERSSPVMLTRAGKKVLEMATTMLSLASSTKRELSLEKNAATAETIRVEDCFFCPCFAEFMYRYSVESKEESLPDLDIRSLDGGLNCAEMVASGKLDLAFWSSVGIESEEVASPVLPGDVIATPLPHSISRVCFLADKTSPLAQKESISLADLRSTRIMMPTMTALDCDRKSVTTLFERYGGFSPLFDLRPVLTIHEFFSLAPAQSVFFTTKALCTRYQEYSTWVLDNTVPLFPSDRPYVRQLFLLHRADVSPATAAAIQTITKIWAEERYYGE